MNAYREVEVDTPAGVYTVELHYDETPEQPYNDGLGFAFDGGRESIDQAMGDHADEVLSLIKGSEVRSAAAIARYLRLKYGFKGIREVSGDYSTGEPSSDRGESFQGLAWAPDDATYPDSYTDAGIAEYRAWANGEVYGYVVLDPDGADFGSCWGFYGDDGEKYMLERAKDEVEYDATQRGIASERRASERLESANLAGAGFVGII